MADSSKASLVGFGSSFCGAAVSVGVAAEDATILFSTEDDFGATVGLAYAGLYARMSVRLERLCSSSYPSETFSSTLAGPALDEDAIGRVRAAGREVVPDTGPAAPTILTAFFLSLILPRLAAGWTARLLRASPEAQTDGAAEGGLMCLERSMISGNGDSGSELLYRAICLRAGDGGGDRREDEAGIGSHALKILLLLLELVLVWVEVEVAGQKLVEQSA